MDKVKKVILLVLVSLTIAVIFWFAVNFSILFGAKDKVYKSIANDQADIILNDDGSTDIYFHDESGVFIGRLVFDIEYDSSALPTDLRVDVNTVSGDLNSFSDINPAYVKTEYLKINMDNVSSIHIETRTRECKIGSFAIDNTLSFSPYLFIFSIFAGMALMCLIIWRNFFILKPQLAFLIIALSLGVPMAVSLPRTRVGYDEEAHLEAVFAIASVPSFELHFSPDALYQLTSTDYNDPRALPYGIDETNELNDTLATVCDYKSGSQSPDFSIILNRVPSYIFMAVGLKIAKFFSLSWDDLILAIRLTNLFLYSVLMYFSIRLIPMGKELIMLIGLLPQCIFMACTCSYDPFIIGCMSLGYAFMLKGRKYFVPMLIAFVLAILPKAVYAPLILMGTVVNLRVQSVLSRFQAVTSRGNVVLSRIQAPSQKINSISLGEKPTEKNDEDYKFLRHFNENKKKFIFLGISIAAIIIITVTLIVPYLLHPERAGDVRGGAISVAGQVMFIWQHPLNYTRILISNMLSTFIKRWLGPDSTTFMGHILNGASDFKGYYQLYIILIILTILLTYAKPIIKIMKNKIKNKRSFHAKIEDTSPVNSSFQGGYQDQISNLHDKNQAQNSNFPDGHHAHILKSSHCFIPGFSDRAWIFLMIAITSILIFTSMYVAFTPLAEGTIKGVQGRYFIPLMFPAYLMLCHGLGFKDNCNNRRSQANSLDPASLENRVALCYYILTFLEFLLLMFTVFNCVIQRFGV